MKGKGRVPGETYEAFLSVLSCQVTVEHLAGQEVKSTSRLILLLAYDREMSLAGACVRDRRTSQVSFTSGFTLVRLEAAKQGVESKDLRDSSHLSTIHVL